VHLSGKDSECDIFGGNHAAKPLAYPIKP